ncbi:MAG: class I SAM-dependent methyltransferase [Marinilabiliaceae bacterium]|nr:class I SAM-dependent methyltransferase [Marinilabiliaceae bacterium]
MSTYQYLNLIIINVLVWLVLSYYWSFWTFKLFKPFKWLEYKKQKMVPNLIARNERKEKDRIRFYSLWLLLERINSNQLEGSLAELGVYKGETAKVIHHLVPDKKLYLFDSFEGLPHSIIREDCDGTVRPQTVKFDQTSPELVEKNIQGNDNVIIRKGIFPETAFDLRDEKFAFVHVDADLYQSTKDALEFFYPNLVAGGIILIHDYNHNWEGVTKAVDEFCQTIPEEFVELPDQLGSVVIIKNRQV